MRAIEHAVAAAQYNTSICGYGSRLRAGTTGKFVDRDSGLVLRTPRNDAGASLRRELHFRRGGADVGVDLRFELGKILLEHADQRTCCLVELDLVGPRLDR